MTNVDSIHNILVPVDGSEPSFDAAALAAVIAGKFDAELRILHVVHIEQSLRILGIYAANYSDLVDKHLEAAKKETAAWFERIRDEAKARNVRMSTEIMTTSLSVVGEIVNYAERNSNDLIVMGTRGLSGFSKLMMGSVATGVVQYAGCPVLTVR